MLALGADSVMLGRAFVYALAAAGGAGVSNLLELIDKEMRVAMTLTGAHSIGEINRRLAGPRTGRLTPGPPPRERSVDGRPDAADRGASQPRAMPSQREPPLAPCAHRDRPECA